MISYNFVLGDIRNRIAQEIDAGKIVDVHEFAAMYVAANSEISGKDRDFHIAIASEHIKQVVGKIAPKFGANSSPSMQPLLADFPDMHVAYPFVRAGRQQIIPVDLCTDEELQNRANEYRRQAEGSLSHAVQIERYLRLRQETDMTKKRQVGA